MKLAAGTYDLTVAKTGYQTATKSVTVTDKELTVETVKLEKIAEVETKKLATEDMDVYVAKNFPSVVRYEMKKGDLFFIHVLDKKLAYRVDQINVIRPEDTRKLQIIDGKDYVTLLTCTPYGVNDHRLLVRGIRTEYHEKEELTKERPHHSQWMVVYRRAILIGLLIVFLLVGSRKMYRRIKGRRKK